MIACRRMAIILNEPSTAPPWRTG